MNRSYMAAAVGLLLAFVALVVWLLKRGKYPDEMERERCLHVHTIGRMTEGQIVYGEILDPQSSGRVLLCYHHHAAGVEHTVAQYISSIPQLATQENCILSKTTAVKYDPQIRSICESWNGMHDTTITTTSAGVTKETLKAG